MGYADEMIIKQMNAEREQTEGSIEDGFAVDEEQIEFELYEFFDGKMKIVLPEGFQDLPPEIAKMKYPMEQRPGIIKTSAEMDMDFTFNLLNQAVTNDQIQHLANTIKKALQRYQPSNLFIDKKMIEVGDSKIAWFDFISNGLDDKLYNVMYYVCVDGKVMNGVFNCPRKKMDDWKPIVLEVLKSIVVEG